MTLRPIEPADVSAVEAIQRASPESARWPAGDYLAHRCLVAEDAGEVVGFAVGRQIVPEEAEILNVAVAPKHRRRGIGVALVKLLCESLSGEIYLEVRASNERAIALYQSLGFCPAGVRSLYYTNPGEDAIVLRLQAC